MNYKKIICAALALMLVILSVAPALAEDKKETVFITTDGSGAVTKTVVSEHLYNPEHASQLKDESRLTDITILSGADSYSVQDGSLIWQTAGDAVRYEAETDMEAPVSLSVSFKLDGKPVEAAQLKGKSGHLEMTVDYSANDIVEMADGEGTRNAPIPFLMMSGMILNPDHFSNVSVTNGKVVDVGNMTILVTWGLPGMTEALGLDGYIGEFNTIFEKDYSTPEFPEQAVVECDVTDLRLSDLYTVAMNAPLSDIDTDDLLPFDLEEAEDEDWSGKVSEIMDKLLDAGKQLTDGAAELADGAKQVMDGAGELSDGLSEIDENSAALTDGARQLFEGILDTANDTLAESKGAFDQLGITLNPLTIDNYADELDRIMSEMLENVEDVVYRTAEKKLHDAVYKAVYAEVVKKVTEAAGGMVAEEVRKAAEAKVRTEVEAAARAKIISSINNMDEATLNAEVEKRMAAPEIRAQVDAMVQEQMKTAEVQAMINQQLEAQIRPQVEAAAKQQVTDTVRAGVRTKVTESVRAEIRTQVVRELLNGAGDSGSDAGEDAQPDDENAPEPEDEAPAEPADDAPDADAPDADAPDADAPETASALSVLIANAFAASANAEELSEEQIEAIVNQQMASAAVQSQINALVEQNMASAEVQALISQQYNAQSTQDSIRAMISAQMEANRAAAEAQAELLVRAQVEAAAREKIINTITNMDEATLNAVVEEKLQSPEIQAQMEAAVAEQMQTEYVQNLIAQNIAEQEKGSYVQEQIQQNVKEQMASAAVRKIIADNIEEQRHGSTYLNGIADALAENGKDGEAYRSLADLKDTLEDVSTFYQGVIDYTDAVGTAKDGAAELADGTVELYDGASELADGVDTLNTELSDFYDGDGQKILDLLESSIVHLPEAADDVFDAMRSYTSFAGMAPEMTGSTRFIFHTVF